VLDWEGTLSELLDFNGRSVSVSIYGTDTEWTLVANLRGILTRADGGWAGAEYLFSRVAEEDANRDDTGFFLLNDRFVSAERVHPDQLTINTQDAVIRVVIDNAG
jgi:hypothetical protein